MLLNVRTTSFFSISTVIEDTVDSILRSAATSPTFTQLILTSSSIVRSLFYLQNSWNEMFCSIMTNLSRLQPCTWIYKILLSHINGGSRTWWCLLYGMDINYTADQPVFLNKSNKDDRVVLHRYGCTPSGQDLVHHVSLNHGVRHSILPALSLSGMRVMEGSIDGAKAALSSPSDLGVSVRATVTVFLIQPLSFVIIKAYAVGRWCI